MGTLSMNLPHLSQATQISTGMENLKPKNPIITPVTWNSEFYTWGTNPQNNNSPSLLPLVKGTLNNQVCHFHWEYSSTGGVLIKFFPANKTGRRIDRLWWVYLIKEFQAHCETDLNSDLYVLKSVFFEEILKSSYSSLQNCH